MAFRANGSDQMTLTNTGLGIGTTSPDSNLHISSASGTELHLQETTAGQSAQIKLTNTARSWVVGADQSPDIFHINPEGSQGTGISIDSSGNVGIGTTSPANLLEVEGTNATGDGVRFGTSSSDNAGNFKLALQTNDANRVEFLATRQASTGGSLDIYTRAVGGTLTNALTIDESQNVGIGTDSPATSLHVNSGANGEILRIQGANAQLRIGNPTLNVMDINSSGSGDSLTLSTDDTERMRIDSSGNVGIGTDSPENPLHVNGGTSNTLAKFESTDDFALIEFKDSNAGATGCFIGGAGDDFVVSPNANEKFRVTSAGNVGIGTNNPTGNLEVKSTAETAAYVTGSASSLRLLAYDLDGSCYIQSGTSTASSQAPLYISGMNGTNITAAFDTANQRVLIGATSNTSTSAKLEVHGSPTGGGQAPSAIINGGIDSSTCLNCIKTSTTTSSSARFIQFYANTYSTPMGGIVGNGSSNAQFQSISDERLKENIQSLSGSLDKVLALNPVSYDWKYNGEHIEAGFVAQEVEQVLPEYVTTEDDEDQIKGLTGGMTAGYIAVLTKAIQEQQTIIDDLKARIETLENN